MDKDDEEMEVTLDTFQWYFIKKEALLKYVADQGFDLGRNHSRSNYLWALGTPNLPKGRSPDQKIKFIGYKKSG